VKCPRSAYANSLTISADYARTLREWDKRFVANVTPEILVKDFPSMTTDPAMFDMFCRKWRYLFAYATAGMASGYLTCHMFTFIRPVRVIYGPSHDASNSLTRTPDAGR
jgi:cyclopropane-fatty-acyl-phospholipid synthase